MKEELRKEKVEQEIMTSYEDLYRMAYSYVKNEEDAMDVVQESVYKAIKNADRIQDPGFIKTWLVRIVINTAIDMLNKRKKETSLDLINEVGKVDSYRDFDTLAALETLEEKEKAIIILRFFHEWKLDEISKSLDTNINTVKTMLYRSLKKLKIELGKGELA